MKEEDPVHVSLEFGIGLILMWTISIFTFNLSEPLFPSLFSSYFETSVSSISVRCGFALLEAYIICFAWNSNIAMLVITQLTTYFATFWVAQLKIDVKNVRNLNRFAMIHRELQLLVVQYNECFATPTTIILFIAFVSQCATNYGVFQLLGKISNGAWATCFYLMVTGTRNLFHLHTMLAFPYLTSEETKEEWQKNLADGRLWNNFVRDRKWFRKCVRSCPALKIYQGSYRHFQRDSGIEFVDSVIDKTVSVLLY
ncbi:unnamed protein product [Orchesella dallaii]|uniref:Uncharacterized protein n=1 Tax=Orchesella dallaii TaxID=48710 RepID=A0ABP1PVZ1_9HEXA